eukprot:RCo013364
MFHPEEIVDPINSIIDKKLYLGNRYAASAQDILKSLGVTHIVNAAEEQPNFFPNDFEYFNCNLKDNLTEKIDFKAPLTFMHRALKEGGVVFVHCLAGVSRSATMVVAYLMTVYRLSLRESLTRVELRRPVINPNANYIQQLAELEIRMFGQGSVDITELLAQRLKSLLAFLDTEVLTNVVRQCNGNFDQALQKSIALASSSMAATN